MPEFVDGQVIDVRPVPPVLRIVPLLTRIEFPELSAKELPSPRKSSTALAALLNAALLQPTCPFVHVPTPLFTRVPLRVLALPPLIASPPFAESTRLGPPPPIVPPDQRAGPDTEIGMLP